MVLFEFDFQLFLFNRQPIMYHIPKKRKLPPQQPLPPAASQLVLTNCNLVSMCLQYVSTKQAVVALGCCKCFCDAGLKSPTFQNVDLTQDHVDMQYGTRRLTKKENQRSMDMLRFVAKVGKHMIQLRAPQSWALLETSIELDFSTILCPAVVRHNFYPPVCSHHC